jgi:hypothetical protein
MRAGESVCPRPSSRPPLGCTYVARTTVAPLAVRAVGDLLALHAEAGIELRFVPDLSPFWAAVVTSGLPFSGIRLRDRVVLPG